MMSAGWLLLGLAVGVLNGLTRWWTVKRLCPTQPSGALGSVVGGMLLRWGLVIGLLIAALNVSTGIIPALLSFVGLWVARWGTTIWFHTRGLES